jgi:hypothetical protein
MAAATSSNWTFVRESNYVIARQGSTYIQLPIAQVPTFTSQLLAACGGTMTGGSSSSETLGAVRTPGRKPAKRAVRH